MIPARLRFEAFAGCHADRPAPAGIDPIDWLQVRLAAWEARQPFHTASALPVALGIVEECGELADAHSSAAIVDALGDIAIYTCQFATRHRLAMSVLIAESNEAPDFPHAGGRWRMVTASAGAVAHLALKREQGIREGALPAEEYRAKLAGAIVRLLADVSDAANRNLAECFTTTAATILTRDWRADPVGGGRAGEGWARDRRVAPRRWP